MTPEPRSTVLFGRLGKKRNDLRGRGVVCWSRDKDGLNLTCTGRSDQDHAEVLSVLGGSLGLDLGFEAVNLLVQLLEQVLDVAEGAGAGGGIVNGSHDDDRRREEWRVDGWR